MLKELRIKAVGDIASGDCTAPGLGILSITRRYGCDFLFEHTRKGLDDCDLLIGNLEGPLSYRCINEDLRMCGLPEMAFSLRKVGFDVISVANNHIMDHGLDIFKETISHCKNAGLSVCGLRGKNEYYSEPVIIEKNGIKVGVLGYNWVGSSHIHKAGDHIAQIYDGIVNYSWTRDKERDIQARKNVKNRNSNVISDIKTLRKHVDILIVVPHWGYEWVIYPPMGVIVEARSFINAGADLILGSHPHVHQAVEIYNSKVIAYSLGNFILDNFSQGYSSGMIISCLFSSDDTITYKLSIIDNDKYYRPSIASEDAANLHYEQIYKSGEVITNPDVEQILDDDILYKKQINLYYKFKYGKAMFLLKTVIRNPCKIWLLIGKIDNIIRILILRLQGKKVRW